MPNLSRARPVLILAWVPASTSGFTRRATRAVRPEAAAMAESMSSSSALSMLICEMPSERARLSSAMVLPTPEKTISAGAMPASRARRSSPSLTTSAPAPSAPSRRSTARWSFAFTA